MTTAKEVLQILEGITRLPDGTLKYTKDSDQKWKKTAPKTPEEVEAARSRMSRHQGAARDKAAQRNQ